MIFSDYFHFDFSFFEFEFFEYFDEVFLIKRKLPYVYNSFLSLPVFNFSNLPNALHP